MMCQPNSLCTGAESLPFSSEKAASSNAFTIWPRDEIAQIAAALAAAILRIFLRGLGEVGAAGDFLGDLLGLVLGLHENVAGAHFLLRRQAFDALLIERLGFGFRHRSRTCFSK